MVTLLLRLLRLLPLLCGSQCDTLWFQLERAAAGSEGALSGDSWVSDFLGEVWVNERG